LYNLYNNINIGTKRKWRRIENKFQMKKFDFEDIYKLIEKLRKKCPWDKSQTLSSMKKEILEEVYELYDAIEKRNKEKIREEIGDILLSLFLMIKIADEKYFKKEELIKSLKEKIIKKHPHVFKGKKFKNKEEFLKFWEKEKKEKEVKLKMPSFLFFEKVVKKLRRLKKINLEEVQREFEKLIKEKSFDKDFIFKILFYSSLILILRGKSPEKILRKEIINWQKKFFLKLER